MNKQVVIGTVMGSVIGICVGFFGANYINRQSQTLAPVGMQNPAAGGAPSMQGGPATGGPPVGPMQAGGPNGGQMIAEVQKAIELAKNEPNNYDAQIAAGDMYLRIQRFDEASKFYHQAEKLKPNDTETQIKLGNAYFDAEKYDESEGYYAKALESDPKNVNVRTDYGLTFYLKQPRDLDRAIKEYQTSLSIDPNHELTLQNLAVAYKDKGDTANFDATVNRLREVNPNNPYLSKRK